MTVELVSTVRPWPELAARGISVTPVDAVMLEARAASLAARSIKTSSKAAALDLAIRCVDLTTLEGADTPGKVRALAGKAVRPDPLDPSVPSVAAVCVYPTLVGVAAEAVAGTGVQGRQRRRRVPVGASSLDLRLAEIRRAVADGADEIDIVLNRSAFLSGRYQEAFDEIVAAKEACGAAHLKTILETGELGTYDQIRRASVLAMAAGADFIKTSTGKISPAATLPTALCMAEAIRDFHRDTGAVVGLSSPAASAPRSRPGSTSSSCSRRSGASGCTRTCSGSARRACSTTCCCNAPSCAPAATRSRRASRSTEARRAMSDIEPRTDLRHRVRERARVDRDRLDRAAVRPLHRRPVGRAARAALPARRSTPRPRRSSPRSPTRAPADVDAAVRAARDAWPAWAALPGRSGRSTCTASPAQLLERAREFAVLETLDGGKPIKESRDVDVPLAAAHFFYYAGWADKLEYAAPGPRRRARRRRRADHPVELPAAHGGVEARARARHRQRVRAQAGGDDAAHRAAARRGVRGSRACRPAS